MSVPVDNPFSLHGPIHHLIDREYELTRLRAYLANGVCCQIVGPAGLGKSSLLCALPQLSAGWNLNLHVAYVNLRELQLFTVPGFLQEISRAWGSTIENPTFEDLTSRIDEWREDGKRPVLCLDDFDALTGRPQEFDSNFFLDLRAVAQKGLVLITASREPLSVLMRRDSPGSPFFNIFAVLRLGPLSEEDAERFVSMNRPGLPPFSLDEKLQILNFAKGMPLALRIACACVLEGKRTASSLATSIQRAESELVTYASSPR